MNTVKNLFFFFCFVLVANISLSQMSQTDYIGTWNMTPMIVGHKLSKMVIKDNGSYLSISLKKEPFKTYNAKYDAVERKLRTNINGVFYYFIYQPGSGKIAAYTEVDHSKFADFQKN